MKINLITRGEQQYIRRRVPKRYAAVEARDYVWICLFTDSPDLARQKAPKIWADMIEAWEAKLDGDTADAEARFAAARELAAKRGYRFLTARKVAGLPIEELAARIDAVRSASRPGKPDMIEAAALLGGAPEPAITMSRALAIFWERTVDRRRGKSSDQIRRWENPFKRAITNLIGVIGDKPIAEITRLEMLEFKDWWAERIETEDMTAGSANKDLIHVSSILNTVNDDLRLGLVLPTGKLAIKGGDGKTRPPFSDDFIRDKLLAPGAMAGLNTEARCILLGMVNTGYRPSEGAELRAEHINLAHAIPHISIEAVGRTLKSEHSKRIIPLCGVSLEAFRECPEGFPRYRNSPNLSGTINKFLRENGLCETPNHTLYCLRHSFEDRMLAAEIDERIRRDLFGHSLGRERYGKGATLEHMQRLVQAISF